MTTVIAVLTVIVGAVYPVAVLALALLARAYRHGFRPTPTIDRLIAKFLRYVGDVDAPNHRRASGDQPIGST